MTTTSDISAPSVGYLIWHVALKWRVAMDRALAPHGLTNAQYAVLASLHALSARADVAPSQRELADFSGLEPMYVSKLVRGLQQAGLLEREPHPSDTRALSLALSRRGEAVVADAARTVRSLHDRLLAPLGGLRSRRTATFGDELQALLRHAAARQDRARGRTTRPT